MSGSTTIARPDQARSQDTLRWGGVVPVAIPQSGPSTADLATALANASGKRGKQLVNAHWRWPLVWGVALVLTPQGFTGDLFVTFAITIGSGDAQQTILRTVKVLNGQTDSTIDNALVLPACDLLIVPTLLQSTDSHDITGPGSIEIGAFVAPQTEPHAMLEALACLCRIEGAGNADERRGQWMEGGYPPGFHPEELGYKR